MQAVENEVETVHLYVVREHEKKPYTLLPLLCALVCLLGIAALTLYSAQHPYYEHERLTVPAQLLPLKTFTAQAFIIPTGVRRYLATYAHGFLTFSNGSVIGLSIPQGFTVGDAATDQAAYVPPGTADGLGMSTVPAHLLTSGTNLSTLSINEVIGASLFVRNLRPFTGGHPAYSVKYVTARDRQTALLQARGILLGKSSGLRYPCQENQFLGTSLKITWRCQFIKYTTPSYMHVTGVRIIGKNLLIDVWFVARPVHIWVK
jgi:hypothetical protein